MPHSASLPSLRSTSHLDTALPVVVHHATALLLAGHVVAVAAQGRALEALKAATAGESSTVVILGGEREREM